MKLNKLIVLVGLCLLSVSCSNLSKNIVEEGSMPIRNGVAGERSWKEDLIFKRYSWTHELNLQFELLLAQVSPQSSFNFWMSKDELETFNKCADARVVLAYSLDSKIIPKSYLYEQLERNGFVRFELLEFKKHLIQHPDAVMNSLNSYYVFGICKKTNDLKPIKISFPGYLEKTLY